jgi:hypothetical protein
MESAANRRRALLCVLPVLGADQQDHKPLGFLS